ncbi:Aminopeptidase O [Pelomyxa schiedti]|nr:Aminopeptidase O [Pelomyxa schiedti]
MVETSPTHDKIRCDFAHCRACARARDEGGDVWVDNSPDQVSLLSRHVGLEVESFVRSLPLGVSTGPAHSNCPVLQHTPCVGGLANVAESPAFTISTSSSVSVSVSVPGAGDEPLSPAPPTLSPPMGANDSPRLDAVPQLYTLDTVITLPPACQLSTPMRAHIHQEGISPFTQIPPPPQPVVPLILVTDTPSTPPSITPLVIFILELDDHMCTLTQWLPSMVRAAFEASAEPVYIPNPAICCRRFSCREGLLKTVWSLADECLREGKPEPVNTVNPLPSLGGDSSTGQNDQGLPPTNSKILVILSTHSSNQGQVFSCTPSSIAAAHNFEEFCSLRDFVIVCQEAFADSLIGIYVSSCFVMRLDSSHKKWPVDIWWLKRELQCEVVGSEAEVYFTGQDTVDLFFVLTLLEYCYKHSPASMPAVRLETIIKKAATQFFDDLCQEMGLCKLSIPRKLLPPPAEEPEVHPAVCIHSSVCILVIFAPTSKRLAESLVLALQKRDDVNVVICQQEALCVGKYTLPDCIASCVEQGCRVLFLALDWACDESSQSEMLLHSTLHFASTTETSCPHSVFGLHIAFVSTETLEQFDFRPIPFPVSAFHTDKLPLDSVSLPLLIYFLQLAVGENKLSSVTRMEETSSKNHVSLAQAANDALPPNHWELIDVVTECNHVCPGLARQAELKLLHSPDSRRTKPSGTGHFTRNIRYDYSHLQQREGATAKRRRTNPTHTKRVVQQDALLLSANIKQTTAR